MARTIRTCSLALAGAVAAAVLPAVPAEARLSVARSGASTFVAAHAAAEAGDARRAAVLYASLAAAEPGNAVVAARALNQAILAGDMTLALRLARTRPAERLTPDARLLLVADRLRSGKAADIVPGEWPAELAFVVPFVRAWDLAERRDWKGALAALDGVAKDDLLASAVPEHKALILLRSGRVDEARPLLSRALAAAGGRADRLRIAFAAGLIRGGQRAEGLALLAGRDPTLARAAQRLASDRRPDLPVGNAAQGFSELLLGLALTLGGRDGRGLPVALVQVARHADPGNEQAGLLLGLLLGRTGREDDALARLRAIDEGSPFVPEARAMEIELLTEAGHHQEALARAQAFVADPAAGADDWARLGDVLDAMKRPGAAAEAYGKAVALADAGSPGPERWTLHLLRGASLEQADRWAEAERALETAHALAPDNPLVLNYLGYARLERGEQLDEAEALIAKASALAPNDASITDSLGWAQFKRGKVAQAIATLGRAAAADPGQAEIHEHLGDALYTAGRKFEARHAWNAALVTAEEEVKTRVEAKLSAGLTAATAAP